MGDFSDEEWELIFDELKVNSKSYGLPDIAPGSINIGSFNIRKLGTVSNRIDATWKFLGITCKRFDLIAVQECMDNLDGIYRLMQELNKDDEYKLICSDKTGTYPGDAGLGERLAFLYRTSTVNVGEVISDITYDRSKVTEIVFDNIDELVETKKKFEADMAAYKSGERKTKPKLNPPTFLSFIRSPYCVSFDVHGGDKDAYKPYQFMAVNAHLIYGKSRDRWREFVALMEWMRDRVVEEENMYYPAFILLGDLNLDYDNPERDFAKLEEFVKNIDEGTPDEVKVNFPFLEIHPNATKHFTSNVHLTQRYDQIGLFFRDDDGAYQGLPNKKENSTMGENELGPDYGVFNFSDLFARALKKVDYEELPSSDRKAFRRRYEHEVSDHMPIWIKLKMRGADK